MVQLPPDIQQVLDHIDEADRVAEALGARLSDRQFHWQPDGGRSWSIAQCLEHLAAINTLYGRGIRGAVDRARQRGWARNGPLAPGPFGRWFIQSQEPPVKRRLRAPGTVRPGSDLTRDEILRRNHEAHAQLRQIARDAATIDANRATCPNPFLKLLRVKVATGLRLLPAHDRRHLWQAEQVTRRPDFPSA
ncbi:MAG: DinB family protein [Vicinamibacterales bacterium]